MKKLKGYCADCRLRFFRAVPSDLYIPKLTTCPRCKQLVLTINPTEEHPV